MSFALIIPTTPDGFWGYLLQKGLHYSYKTPFIFKHVEGSAIKAAIATTEA